MTPVQPLPRARGLVVAAIGAGFPVVAHVAAGGSVSLPPVTLLPLALAVALCVTASAKTWTVTRLTIALTGVGLLTHAALWTGHAPLLEGGKTAALAHHATSNTLGVAAVSDPSAGHALGLTPPMVMAHVVAVLLSVALLRHGEKLLLWLWSLAQRSLPTRAHVVPIPELGCPVHVYEPPPLTSYLGISGGQRAPPQLASIA